MPGDGVNWKPRAAADWWRRWIFSFEFFFGLVPHGGVIGGAISEQVPEDARQVGSRGGDGFWCVKAGPHASIIGPKGG